MVELVVVVDDVGVVDVVGVGEGGKGRMETGEEGGVDLLPLTEKGFCPTGLFHKSWQGEPP